ncbi:MAG: response regulator [Bacteroidota bacterium]
MSKDPFIIIAEDDADDRLMIQEVLDESAVKINYQFARDGEILINLLKNNTIPSLILLDLNMPKIDGRQALQMIKAESSLQQIPIVILTTSINQDDKDRCFKLGADDYIAKPSNYNDMRIIISRLREKWLKNN